MNEQSLDNWTTQLRKGLLDLCVLNAIADRRMYGYDIVRTLRSVDGLVITEGTVYPLLSRLRRDGLVQTTLEESGEGPARKYYELTSAGRNVQERMNAAWAQIVEGVKRIQSGINVERREHGQTH